MNFCILLTFPFLSLNRCYYLALAYQHGSKFIEASSLLQRCQSRARDAEKALSANEEEEGSAVSEAEEMEAVPGHSRELLTQLMHDLADQAEAETLACKAGYMLELAGGDASVEAGSGGANISRAALKEVSLFVVLLCMAYLSFED